jgi:hypothetical protein
MFATRSIGIRTLSLFWQLIIVTLSFWGWLFIWQNSVFQESSGVQRYILYFEFLIIGVVISPPGCAALFRTSPVEKRHSLDAGP